MPERTLDYMLVTDLDPNPDNPKAHDVEELRAAIVRLGFVGAVVLDERTGQLIAGHGRTETLIAAQQANLDPPDGIVADEAGWWVPVVRGWESKDDDEAKAALVALNHVGEGLWNDNVRDLLSSLRDGPGLEGLGVHDDDHLGELLNAAREPAATPGPTSTPFADFGEQNKPDVVDFRFGDYSGKLSRPLYARFVEEVEKRRSGSDAVLLDDVLTEWLRLSVEPAVYVDNSADRRDA